MLYICNTKTIEIMITAIEYKEANAAGLRHRESGVRWGYYTPTLRVAYNLGLDGISLQDAEEVEAFRFGKAPESFISWNYREDMSEKGLSVYTDGDVIRSEFADRKVYTYRGIVSGRGGDDELLILSFDAENLD